MKRLGINVKTIPHALCESCGSLYPPDSPTGRYPDICTRPVQANRTCDVPLTNPHNDGGNPKPRRIVSIRDFFDWIDKLLNNEVYMDAIDKSWEAAQKDRVTPDNEEFHDFWDGDHVRSIPDPLRPGQKFCNIPDGETRLAFTLSIDWFNPFFNKAAGKNASVGVVFLVCLNIPIEDRYKEDNMLLWGIIPGPHEPSVDDGHLNHLLDVNIDIFVEFWEKGVYYTHTAKYKLGCLVRIILVLLLCDIPAARKVSGLPGHGATYPCSVCKIRLKELWDIRIADDPRSLRTSQEIREAAHRASLRANPFEPDPATGIRSTPLHRLPYFDVIRSTGIDSMHLFFLRIVYHHFLSAWEMRQPTTQSQKRTRKQASGHWDNYRLDADMVLEARSVFVSGSSSKLRASSKAILLFLCVENNIPIKQPWNSNTVVELHHALEVRV
jgi:hypothetical protein